jgi:hypothetical protein
MSTAVMTEDFVVESVCRSLVDQGFEVKQQLLATQRGFDIVALKDGRELVVEAKGAGSSKIGTARFGRSFTSGQVFDHVAKAVLKALRVVTAGSARAGIALPDDANHRREVAQVAGALDRLGVVVFWVNENGDIRTSTDLA